MAFEVLMRDCATEEDRRAKRDELMQREEARLAAVAISDARLGKYDRLLDGLRTHLSRKTRPHSNSTLKPRDRRHGIQVG